MYSRQNIPRQQSAPWQIPKNYSGNAFSQPQPQRSAEQEEEEAYAEKNEDTQTLSSPPFPTDCKESDKKSGLFGLSRKGGGIGFEELLILGLVLLISQSDESEGNNDLAFLLLLLLFI